jgi:hypothetical protein
VWQSSYDSIAATIAGSSNSDKPAREIECRMAIFSLSDGGTPVKTRIHMEMSML